MDFFAGAPDWLIDLLPEGAKDFLTGGGWWAVLGAAALIILLVMWGLLRKILRSLRGRPTPVALPANLQESLADYPPLPTGSGDRRLTVEGVPVRLRLVVVAPAGTESHISPQSIPHLLNRVVGGLGEMMQQDQSRVRIWPVQLSYEGFVHTFHRNTQIPEGENEPSPWVLVAGRAKVGGQQVMIGLGLQALHPTTLGRRTLQQHEWPTVLRVRVREGL